MLLREGRRCGYDSVQVAGVTFFSSATEARLEGKSKPRGKMQAEGNKRKPKHKSEARRAKDEEIHRNKRMRRKLFSILPIINKVMGEAASEAAPRAAAEEQMLPQPAEDVVLPQFAGEPMWVPSGRPQLTEQAEVVYWWSTGRRSGRKWANAGGRARGQTHRRGVGISPRGLA